MDQGTPEWLAERAGKVTASKIADVMAKTKSGYGAARRNYMAQIITERLTGLPTDSFTSGPMQWGIDTEPQARAAYSFATGNAVTEVGFVPHPDLQMTGASPDGLVSDDGLVEIKCPNSATHIATLRGAEIDRKYLLQMHWQMACCEREWCDFVSFDPRLPEEMQLRIQRVERDAELVEEITAEVAAFLAEIDVAVTELTEKYLQKEAA